MKRSTDLPLFHRDETKDTTTGDSTSKELKLLPTSPTGMTSAKIKNWQASSETKPNPVGTPWRPLESTRPAGRPSKQASSDPLSINTQLKLYAPTSTT